MRAAVYLILLSRCLAGVVFPVLCCGCVALRWFQCCGVLAVVLRMLSPKCCVNCGESEFKGHSQTPSVQLFLKATAEISPGSRASFTHSWWCGSLGKSSKGIYGLECAGGGGCLRVGVRAVKVYTYRLWGNRGREGRSEI